MHRAIAHLPEGSRGIRELPQDFEIGRLSTLRSGIASEIGAAMAHELSGPMTALMLYIADLQQKLSGLRFLDANGDGQSMKNVAAQASREAERVCGLIHRMGDMFVAPIPAETAIETGRDVIAWWARPGKIDADAFAARADAPFQEP